MERTTGEVSLPLKTLVNVNPTGARVRADLGDLQPLVRSLHEEGLRLPLLVGSDFTLVEGARRLAAIQQLPNQVTEVPVIVATTWEKVVDYYARTWELHQQGYESAPLNWKELDDLAGRVLPPLFATEGAIARRLWQAERDRARAQGRPEPPRDNHRLRREVGRCLLPLYPSLSNIRDLLGSVAAFKDPANGFPPEYGDTVAAMVDATEKADGATSALMHLLRDLRSRRIGLEELQQYRVRPKGHRQDAGLKLFPRPAHVSKARTDGAAQTHNDGFVADEGFVQRLATMLEGTGQEARQYRDVSPHVSLEEAKAALRKMNVAARDIGKFRQVLRTYLEEKDTHS